MLLVETAGNTGGGEFTQTDCMAPRAKVGGMIGFIASQKGSVDAKIRRAMIHGSVVASFCCEGFGLQQTTKVTPARISQRVKTLEKLVRF